MTGSQQSTAAPEQRSSGRFTVRNLGGVALFLFGSTFAWTTPAFAGAGLDTSGIWWAVAQFLSLAAIVGFTVATWGLFRRSSWWAVASLASAVIGVLAMVPYWIAAHASGETTPWFTVLVHLLGCVGVFVLLLVPSLRAWVDRHVASGR